MDNVKMMKFWGRILNKDTQLFNHGERYTYG